MPGPIIRFDDNPYGLSPKVKRITDFILGATPQEQLMTALNPADVIIPGPVAGLPAVIAKMWGKLTAEAPITSIAADPMGLKKGPIDRRNFMYRATGAPARTAKAYIQDAREQVLSEVGDLGKLVDVIKKTKTGELDLRNTKGLKEAFDTVDTKATTLSKILDRHPGLDYFPGVTPETPMHRIGSMPYPEPGKMDFQSAVNEVLEKMYTNPESGHMYRPETPGGIWVNPLAQLRKAELRTADRGGAGGGGYAGKVDQVVRALARSGYGADEIKAPSFLEAITGESAEAIARPALSEAGMRPMASHPTTDKVGQSVKTITDSLVENLKRRYRVQ